MSDDLLRRAAKRLREARGGNRNYDLAVAQWLDRVETAIANGDPGLSLGEPTDARLVARAYLGESS